jgi:hypothetical protein
MPFNGSGTYTLPAGNPVVNNTIASSTVHNNTNSDIATALTNCLTKDGQSTPTANIKLGGYKITGLGDGTALTDAPSVKQVQNSSFINLTSVAGTNTITASATPTPSAYADGQIFELVPANTNTGASTLNISGLGARTIIKNGAPVVAGVLTQDFPVLVRYSGITSDFEIVASHDNLSLRHTGTQAMSGSLRVDGNFTANGSTITFGDSSADAITCNAATVAIPNGLNFGSGILNLSGGNVSASGNFTVTGNLTVNGNTNIGNTVGDSVAINAGTATIPNGLNVASNQFVLDTSGNTLLGLSSNSGFDSASRQLILNGASTARFAFGIGGAQHGGLYADSNQISLYTSGADLLSFQTNGSERARVTSGGVFLASSDAIWLNTAGAAHEFSCPTSQAATSRVVVIYHKQNTGDNAYQDFYTTVSGSPTFTGGIRYNRAGGLTVYATSSDGNLKHIVGDADLQESFDLVMGCKLREYWWLHDETKKPQIGVIAQEEYKRFKGSVTVGGGTDENGNYLPWGVDRTAYVWHLVGTCQKQQQEIESLKSRLDALESIVNNLNKG